MGEVVAHNVFAIRRLIDEYDRLIEGVTHKKTKPRPPISILKRLPIWGHIVAMVARANSCQADPLVFLAAQFRSPMPPFTTQLAGDAAMRTYHLWLTAQRSKYASSTGEAITAASVIACGEASTIKALEYGAQLWHTMREAHGENFRPLDAALSVANMLPPQFLLSFPEVEKATRDGIVVAPLLVAMVELLDQTQNQKLWSVVRTWQTADRPGSA